MDKVLQGLNIDKILKYFLDNIENIIIALLIIVFFDRIAKFILAIIKRMIFKSSVETGVKTFSISIITIIIKIFLILAVISLLDINITSIVTLIGAMGVVLGFAFKETMGNFAGGIMILVFKPFKIGDTVSIDGREGTVKNIDIFYTTLLNYQNEDIIIPNGIVITTVVSNIWINEIRRLDIVIRLGYGADIDKIKKILNNIIDSEKGNIFSENHDQSIGLVNILDGYLELEIKSYVLPNNIVKGKYCILENLVKQLENENLQYSYNIISIKDGLGNDV